MFQSGRCDVSWQPDQCHDGQHVLTTKIIRCRASVGLRYSRTLTVTRRRWVCLAEGGRPLMTNLSRSMTTACCDSSRLMAGLSISADRRALRYLHDRRSACASHSKRQRLCAQPADGSVHQFMRLANCSRQIETEHHEFNTPGDFFLLVESVWAGADDCHESNGPVHQSTTVSARLQLHLRAGNELLSNICRQLSLHFGYDASLRLTTSGIGNIVNRTYDGQGRDQLRKARRCRHCWLSYVGASETDVTDGWSRLKYALTQAGSNVVNRVKVFAVAAVAIVRGASLTSTVVECHFKGGRARSCDQPHLRRKRQSID